METIKTEPIEILVRSTGIRLKQFTASDSQAVFELIDKNRDHLSQFGDTTAEKYKSVESVEKSISNPKNPDRLRFGIWNEKQEFVGSVNLTPDEKNKQRGEIGYYLSPKHTGKGHMLNAVLTLVTYAFTKGEYEELYGKVHKDNIGSQKVLLKSGFIESGSIDGDLIFTLKIN
jgi:RimJ/RimL family protein N-acetyltransferase